MKSNDQKRALFDAVTGIDDDLITEAAAPRIRFFSKRVLRVAAVAAVFAILLTAICALPEGEHSDNTEFGSIKVYAYDAMGESDVSNMGRYQMTDGVDPYCPFILPSASMVHEIMLQLEVDESKYNRMEITYEISTNYGCLRKIAADGEEQLLECGKQQKCVLLNGDMFAWHEKDMAEPYQDVFDRGDRIFIDVIVKAGGHFVGYAVIEICYLRDPIPALVAQLLEIKSFPVIDGEWQDITEADIVERIANCHEMPPKDVHITIESDDVN